MENRISEVHVEIRRLDPVEAEALLLVVAEQTTPTTEVRGRVVGPRCAGVTTVEVAYPFRPSPRQSADLPGLAARVVIPEPSLWKPETPFVYEVVVELWQDGQRCDRRVIADFRLTPPANARRA
jgi:hypothetical protein